MKKKELKSEDCCAPGADGAFPDCAELLAEFLPSWADNAAAAATCPAYGFMNAAAGCVTPANLNRSAMA